MNKITKKSILALFCIILFLIPQLVSISNADERICHTGFSKGVSHKPVVPLKKVTFVQSDQSGLLDDYSYLSSVPTSVFHFDNQLYSHPLLFLKEKLFYDEEKATLDSRVGIDYFMQDWMSYCNQKLDEITLINVDKNDLDVNWRANEYNIIQHETPQEIASTLALSDWSYSNEAVLTVIPDKISESKQIITNSIPGKILAEEINRETSFSLTQTNSLNPVFEEFIVPEEYTFIHAEVWWDCLILGPGIMVPTGDPDIQLYCKQKDGWMQTSAASFWNVYQPAGKEYTQSHVYESGKWRVGITDLPTEGESPEKKFLGGNIILQGSLIEALKSPVNYHVDITMYPGTIIDLPDSPPFGCKDSVITVSWSDSSIDLGCSIVGPGGEAIITRTNNTSPGSISIDFETLGECPDSKPYKVSVFSMDSLSNDIHFTIEYEWKQEITREKSDSLTSATHGAVLASILNVPLLYTSSDKLSTETKNVIEKLGVKKIHLIDLGNHLASSVKRELDRFVDIKSYDTYQEIFSRIKKYSTSNDIVFSTIDPWTYWYLGELEPGGETEADLFIGPAAYLAAHHGCPVFIIDNHPRLSSAVVWHNEFWKRNADDRYFHTPSTAEMVLTGKQIYDFLSKYGFDREGEEYIITVADQYDIGVAWDRIFPGVAHAGRICGSPVDTSYWISRSIFYPALIFENPALKKDLLLINGSRSQRGFEGLFGKTFDEPFLTINLGNYVKTREQQKESFKFPVQCSFVTHRHRFNERASSYYGMKYQCADDNIPGQTATFEPIDQGTIEKYTGKTGSYFPDMTETEIIPLYLKRGGFSPVFSTNLSAVISNVNDGVLLWVHTAHGLETEGGQAEFWEPSQGFSKIPILLVFGQLFSRVRSITESISLVNQPFPLHVFEEPNPWRGYEWLLGSTDEPDTMSMDINGILPFTNLKVPLMPALGQDWVLAKKPVRELLNKIIPFIDPFTIDDLHDGVIATSYFSRLQNSFKSGLEIEKNLGNLHSVGFITSMCQTSNTYLHLMLIRHGSVFQVQDPWPTSWYGAVWRQSIPRDIILGNTVGEAYSNGMSHVGTLYISDPPQWWWDTAENVVYFGDPQLRMYVPSTKYSDKNTWDSPQSLYYDENMCYDGHMPFGATDHPNEIEQINYIMLMLYSFVIVGIILIIFIVIKSSKNKSKKEEQIKNEK